MGLLEQERIGTGAGTYAEGSELHQAEKDAEQRKPIIITDSQGLKEEKERRIPFPCIRSKRLSMLSDSMIIDPMLFDRFMDSMLFDRFVDSMLFDRFVDSMLLKIDVIRSIDQVDVDRN
jgi:hypothetical protein